MWANKTRLPHVLPPSAYSSRAFYEREMAKLFKPGWHFVATNHELARHGDFVTTDVLGTPVLVRRHEERLKAFVNVCAHRHARLTHEPRGSCERLSCQYHGWEYSGADGEVCTIPDASSFVPLGRKGERERLANLRVEMLGGLVFVSLAAEGLSLREHLGERAVQMIERWFHASLREDAAVYVDVQRGMEASLHAGVLGRREERVHAFQAYVARACACE